MPKSGLWVLGLCIVVGSVMFAAGTAFRPNEAHAQVGGAAGDIVAVAIRDNAEFPTLFVIDSKVRHLACYRAEPSSQKLRLIAVRNIDWDLQIPTQFPAARGSGSSTRDPSVLWIRENVLRALENQKK